MKKIIPLWFLTALTILFISCQKNGPTANIQKPDSGDFEQIRKVSWLEGKWENTSKEGILTETWTKENDSTFHGKTYFIVDKDTAFTETIQLRQQGDQLLYIPTVNDQNDGEPIGFMLTNCSKNQLLFENKDHDFPQKIRYTKVTNDSLVAEISGVKAGKESRESYPMKRK